MQRQRHSVTMEAMQPSVEVTQTVDMAMVEEVAEEAGIENPEDLLNEAVHHDHDEDATLTVEELQSAAEVVVAQQDVMKEVEPAPEPTPEPVVEEEEPEINIDDLVEQATAHIKEEHQRSARFAQTSSQNRWCSARRSMEDRRRCHGTIGFDNHAIAAMTHAQNLEPTHAPGWFNLGSVQQRSALVNEALASYRRAVESTQPMKSCRENGRPC